MHGGGNGSLLLPSLPIAAIEFVAQFARHSARFGFGYEEVGELLAREPHQELAALALCWFPGWHFAFDCGPPTDGQRLAQQLVDARDETPVTVFRTIV